MCCCFQVVLILDTREQFGRSVGGRNCGNHIDSRDERIRQLQNLGIKVMVCAFKHTLTFRHTSF
jgi:hypothetical protein